MNPKSFIFAMCLSSAALSVSAQLKIHNNTLIGASGVVSTSAPITNSSPNVDLSGVHLKLLGTSDQQITTTQALSIAMLRIDQGGTKIFSGSWEVLESIEFLDGIVKIGNGAKLTYSGSERIEGNDNSFVDGFLFRKGSGQLFFPVGIGSTYAPAILESAPAGEYGMQVFTPATDLVLPAEVLAAFTDHHWELSEVVSSPVSLGLNGLEGFLGGGAPVILEAPAPGDVATLLSSSSSADFVTSSDNVSQKILAIGKTAEFTLVIHDMITPFTLDEKNDKLFIENLEKVSENNVKLLDRWGVVAAEWKNYSNEIEYDFSKLSPGNYICVVEFTYPGESRTATAKGIVTILKSN